MSADGQGGLGRCPGREELERFAAGASPGETSAAIEAIEAIEAIQVHVAACPECARRIAGIEADNELLAEFVGANRGRLSGERELSRTEPPEGYEILHEIHRGSQGVVYRAIQTATKRTVALKVMLQGAFATERQRRRFEREVELVASLRHPNIVTVFDSGVDGDGRHYLAMEYVPGVPLGEHLGEVGATAPVRETLDLFAKVGDAVACAHRRGIIHRDLKPENILVDREGEPHVLDFGLAKIVGPGEITDSVLATAAGEFLGTFAYAAPEQVSGDPALVDTRTDVHALGVILYEMLTGRRPLELTGSVREIIDAIAEGTPSRPSAVRADLDADVETIVLEALAKEPGRRYQSVQEMVADVRHYLAGEPIAARRDDTIYVLLKTVRRHKAPVAAGAALVLLLVAFGITMWTMYVAKLEESRRALRTLESLVGVIAATDQENPSAPLPASSIVDLLDEASRTIEEELTDLPEVAATVRTSLGLAYMSYSELEKSEAHLAFALETYERFRPTPHPDVANALHNFGRLRWKNARYDEAEQLYRRALDQRRALFPGDHADVARTMHHLASTLRFQGKLKESERWFTEALGMRERALGKLHPDVANNINGLGNCYYDMQRYRDALARYEQALAMISGARDFRGARALHNIAKCQRALGRIDEAEASLLDSLGIKIARESRPEESAAGAEAYLRRVLADETETEVDENLGIATALHEIARVRSGQGRAVEAGGFARRALAIRTAVLSEDHPEVASSLVLLGEIRLGAGDPDEAEGLLRRAIESRRAIHGGAHWKPALAEITLGRCFIEQGRLVEANEILLPARDRVREALGADAPSALEADALVALVAPFLDGD